MSWLVSLLLVSSIFTTENGATYKVNQNYDNTEGKKVIVLDETERIEQSYPLNSNGKVSVSNVNGSITVEAWDRNEVKLEATKIADSKETLGDVEIRINSKPEYFEVETDYNNTWNGDKNWSRNRRLEVQYKLTVPRTAFLNEIETVNGSVVVSNFTNFTKVSAVNGSVKAMNIRGTARLSTVNGTTNADFDQLSPSDKINLSTVNGSVNLMIPSDSNATVKADTVNGSIKNDFGLPVRKGKYVGRDLYGKIGSGQTEIKVSSVNGGLSITRKNDGRNQNPVTNLLPQKSNDDDDEDWDDDSEEVVSSERLNRDINREINRSNARAAQAVAEAKKSANKAAVDAANIPTIVNDVAIESLNQSINAITVEVDKEVQQKLKEKLKLNEAKLARLRNVNFNLSSPVIESKSDTFTVKGKPKIRINAGNCDVTVRGWDASEVKYELTHVSKNKNSSPVSVTSQKNNSDINIQVKASSEDDFRTGNRLLRLEVFVPKKSDLKIVTDGEIRLEGITGEIDLSSAESSVDVRDSDGRLVLNAVEGKIRVIGFNGAVRAETVTGDIYLEGEFSKINANSSEGDLYLSLSEDANATIQSGNEIVFEDFEPNKQTENLWRIGESSNVKYILETDAGTLTVRKALTSNNTN